MDNRPSLLDRICQPIRSLLSPQNSVTEVEEIATVQKVQGVQSANKPMATGKHIDIEQILEDYGWKHFQAVQATRATRHSEFKNLEREDVEFDVNMKKLRIVHEEPQYTNLHPKSAKPYSLFKSVYTNNTERPQEYSFKTERTTESVVSVAREQGYSIGQEAELSLKTPCEILECKAGFKYEMHFNNLAENSVVECLTWGVDSNVLVPPHFQTTASIIIEEMNYQGAYNVVSRIAGPVTIVIRRRKDGALIAPVTTSVAEVFRELFDSGHAGKDLKAMASIEQNGVKLVSKGTCSFQFAMKQKIDLTETPMPRSDVDNNQKEKMMID